MANQDNKQSTGYRCHRDELFVGDILSVQSGYGGFVCIVERGGKFLLEEYDVFRKSFTGKSEGELTHDIGAPYRKVDPEDPCREPPFEILCSQCQEAIIGYFDAEDGSITWTEECGEHYEKNTMQTLEINGKEFPYEGKDYGGRCRACVADPSRKSQTVLLQEYFARRYQEEDLHIQTVHRPVFSSESDVDTYVEGLKKIQEAMGKMYD